MLLFAFLLTPILVIILFVYFQDKYSPEPSKMIFFALLLGLLAIFPAVLLEFFFEYIFSFVEIKFLRTVLYAFIGVGLVEELSKFFFLWLFIYKNKHFDEPMDGVVYAVVLSLGFAGFENIMYVLNSHEPYVTATIRAFYAIPAHASFGAIMGLYFGLSKFTFLHKRQTLHLKAVLYPSIAHGFYDVFLFLGCKYCVLFTTLTKWICVFIALRIIARFKEISPFKKKYLFIHRKHLTERELKNMEELKQRLLQKFHLKKHNK